jgi:hypothetical protein
MGPLTALLVLAATREASIEETSEGGVAPLIETDELTREADTDMLNKFMLNKLHKLLKSNNELDRNELEYLQHELLFPSSGLPSLTLGELTTQFKFNHSKTRTINTYYCSAQDGPVVETTIGAFAQTLIRRYGSDGLVISACNLKYAKRAASWASKIPHGSAYLVGAFDKRTFDTLRHTNTTTCYSPVAEEEYTMGSKREQWVEPSNHPGKSFCKGWRQANYLKVLYLDDLASGLIHGKMIFLDLDWELTVADPFSQMAIFDKDLIYYRDEDAADSFANFGLWFVRFTPAMQYAFKLMHAMHSQEVWWDQELFNVVFASAFAAEQMSLCSMLKKNGLNIARNIGSVRRRRLDSQPGSSAPFQFWSPESDKKYGRDRKNHPAKYRCGTQTFKKEKPQKDREIYLPAHSCVPSHNAQTDNAETKWNGLAAGLGCCGAWMCGAWVLRGLGVWGLGVRVRGLGAESGAAL